MSAFIVSDRVINDVVNALRSGMEPRTSDPLLCDLTASRAKELAERMFAINCEAVEQRYGYGEAEKFRALDFKYANSMPPTKMLAYKALACWRYQSGEGRVVHHEVFKALDSYYNLLAHDIVHDLPAYKKLPYD